MARPHPLDPNPSFPTHGWRMPRVPHQGKVTLPLSMSDEQRARMGRAVTLWPEVRFHLDQMWLGRCAGQTVVALLRLLLRLQGYSEFTASALALYWAGRVALGTTQEDSGAILADILDAVSTVGFASESLWPYVPERFAEEPPQAYRDACAHARLVNRDPLAHDSASHHWELIQGHPIAIGIRVFPSFKTDEVARTGIVPMPRDDEEEVGGHGLLAIGYDPGIDYYETLNWWTIDGQPWGADGRAWIPGAYVRNPLLCGEIHVGRAVRVLEAA